jgi:hypothetical protein
MHEAALLLSGWRRGFATHAAATAGRVCALMLLLTAAALASSLLYQGVVAAGPGSELPVGPAPREVLSWPEWKRHFSAEYPDDATERQREAAFEANVRYIAAHNAEADAGRSSYRLGVNALSDLSSDEYRARHLNNGRHERSSAGAAAASNAALPRPTVLNTTAVPAAVDWRSKGAVTPVKNQGHCGGCWAFGVIGSVEGAYQIATGELRSLSEQQLLDCDTIQLGCSGGNAPLAFKYVVENGGVDSEDEYKYWAEVDPCWTAAEKRHVASIDSYAAVPPRSDAALAAAVARADGGGGGGRLAQLSALQVGRVRRPLWRCDRSRGPRSGLYQRLFCREKQLGPQLWPRCEIPITTNPVLNF